MGSGPKGQKACDNCNGTGLIPGPHDPEAGGRPIVDCQRCAGTGALILCGLRKGQPFYGRPRTG